MWIVLFVRPLSFLIAVAVVLYFAAIPARVSPERTAYVVR